MDSLRAALEALAVTLEADHSLAQSVAFIEREFAAALGAKTVSIGLGDAPHPQGAPFADAQFPLVLDTRTIGTVTFAFRGTASANQRDYARALVAPLAAALAWRAHESERDRLFELVHTDALTGLANRMAFDERLAAAWRTAADAGSSITLALLDIDYFKMYNDMYGHVGGDECLRTVGSTLAEEAQRAGAFVARYGGEEFALIAEGLEAAAAIAAISRVLRAFEDRPIVHEGSTLSRVSISAGVASGKASEWPAAADFVREADRSLYRAKALGRNRICAGTYASTGPVASRSSRSMAGPPTYDDATVGREADLTRLLSAMRQARMISLVGPAGIGKSRLGCLAGAAAEQFFTDGVAYVDFSMLASDSDPVGAIAASLDIVHDSSDEREGLCNAVRERNLLVVLDNVSEANAKRIASVCNDLLAAAPELSILATSRAALGCTDERTVVVAALGEEAALELLRVRSGSTESASLRRIAQALGGVPGPLEDMGRLLALQRNDLRESQPERPDSEKKRHFFFKLDGRGTVEAPTVS